MDRQRGGPEASVEHLCDVDALIIPGGFGDRGMGQIACRFARRTICLFGNMPGHAIAVINFQEMCAVS